MEEKDPFYMVYISGQKGPEMKHNSLESADAELHRLLNSGVGKRGFVLKSIHCKEIPDPVDVPIRTEQEKEAFIVSHSKITRFTASEIKDFLDNFPYPFEWAKNVIFSAEANNAESLIEYNKIHFSSGHGLPF